MVFICDSVHFSYYIVLRSFNFSVTGINNLFLLAADCIFSLTFFVGSFEICYSFAGFIYVYCLIHQSVDVFCLVFVRKSAAQFFSNVQVRFVLHHVQFFVFFNFSNAHVCFVLHNRIAIQFFFFFLYLSILVMFMSVLCSVMFGFLVFFSFINVLQGLVVS